MFPTLPTIDQSLESLAVEVLRRSAALGKGVHPGIISSLNAFMLPVTSYYTNAMEGNPSKLIDIENALNKKLSKDVRKRNYQLEHVAHIETQKEMYRRLNAEPQLDVTTVEFFRWLHKEFYQRLPLEFHFAQMVSGERVPFTPGELRSKGVLVGRHHAPETPEELQRCLTDFNRAYKIESLPEIARLVALAASHHRFLWIHPFADGNGRVARLFTEAYAHKINLNRDHLWTVTRAFARNRDEYDGQLAKADDTRQHDYDGRGPLSERNLAGFCAYFLSACLDQIVYTEGFLELKEFRRRFERFLTILADEKKVSKSAGAVLRILIKEGELQRQAVREICDVKERRASQIIGELLAKHLVVSTSSYGVLRLNVTNEMATHLFPKLV